jgi:peptidoglycan hydrolase-like protein with peptidoglycan-binding domain
VNWNSFKGRAKRIDDIDIPRIGHTIGVGEDELHAFMDVEAAGSGFDSAGRPKMLFEPHVFYRNLSGEKRSAAVAAGLAYPDWRRNYPSDSYPRLHRAMEIDETAALKAASWGLTQILGENHARAGFNTPQSMVRAFMDDEEEHLAATVRLLVAMKIDDDLRAHNWAGVARVWNGPGYRANAYDTKMAAAFARWRKIKDTPWSPGDPVPTTPFTPPVLEVGGIPSFPEIDPNGVEAFPVLRPGDGISKNLKLRPYVAKAQEALGDVEIDGKFGPSTELAVRRFQGAKELTIDGVIGRNTWRALLVPAIPTTIEEIRQAAQEPGPVK